jgi:hypothetical protein
VGYSPPCFCARVLSCLHTRLRARAARVRMRAECLLFSLPLRSLLFPLLCVHAYCVGMSVDASVRACESRLCAREYMLCASVCVCAFVDVCVCVCVLRVFSSAHAIADCA